MIIKDNFKILIDHPRKKLTPYLVYILVYNIFLIYNINHKNSMVVIRAGSRLWADHNPYWDPSGSRPGLAADRGLRRHCGAECGDTR